MPTPPYPLKITCLAHRWGRRRNLDPRFVLAIWWQESSLFPQALGDWEGYDPSIASHQLAAPWLKDGKVPMSYGLGQLHLRGAGFGHDPHNLLKPGYNAEFSTSYLKACADAFPASLHCAASAYNQGIYGARSRGCEFNKGYVDAVMAHFEQFKTTFS